MTDTILKVSNLKKSYGNLEVLKGIDISIKQGEFLVLLGPSGCGKSTLLNCIAGLEEISDGTLEIASKTMNNVPPKDRNIAMVFQSYALYPNMTVSENIAFGMKIRKMPQDIQKQKIAEVGELLQLTDMLDRKPSQLSGGQRQRVAMGRALVRDPKLFLFDEPLSNLDAKLRVEMRAEIRRLHKTIGASIVYVTHDQIEALTLATKIVVLKDGIVQQVGSPEEIYDHPANMFVAEFMGSPSMNLIPAQYLKTENGPQCKIGHQDAAPIFLNLGNADLADSESFTLGIRPEDISTANDNNAEEGQIIECEIIAKEPTGSDLLVTTRLGGADVQARLKAGTKVKIGETIRLCFDMSKASAFRPETGLCVALLHRSEVS